MRKRGKLRGWPAADVLAAHLYDAEQRAQVRAHIAETGISMRSLAAEIGFTDYRLRAFLSGAEVWELDKARLDRWCEGKPLPFVHAEEVAVLVLSGWGALERRGADRQAIADAVLRAYQERGFRVPPFIEEAIRGP